MSELDAIRERIIPHIKQRLATGKREDQNIALSRESWDAVLRSLTALDERDREIARLRGRVIELESDKSYAIRQFEIVRNKLSGIDGTVEYTLDDLNRDKEQTPNDR